MKKIREIIQNVLPILIMIGLIPLIHGDYWLSLAYVVIIVGFLTARCSKNDLLFFVFGIFAMTIFESIFISTGVEVFQRNSLFGLMPVWLPILWGYGFVVIKRAIEILNQ
jgi:hypothetical protein